MQCLPKLRHVTLSPPPLDFCLPKDLPLSSVLLDFQHLSDHYDLDFDLTGINLTGVRVLNP